MKKTKILAVDDSAAVRGLYKELLDSMNAETHLAEDGREALEKTDVTDFDLIVTDVSMPKMNGIELCRALHDKPETRDIPIVIVSTFDSDMDIERGFKSGASAYLSKKDVRLLLKKTVSKILWKTAYVHDRKILIVDDSRSILELVEEGLSRSGFHVVCARNGRIALDFLSTQKPDLILSDINMPEVDGFELCKTVKANPHLASIPFVVMSSNDDKINMKRMIQYGAAGYLVKPFNLNQLVILIERILSDHFLLLLKERERLDNERNSLLDSITSLVFALEARDAYTRGHSEAVSSITSQMVALYGAGKTDVQTVAIGGRLHDIGKIGIRDAVLMKPGRLTREEFDHVKTHPAIGKNIIEPIPSLGNVLPIVYSHHERWDGTGYPKGLKGTQIHLWARITAVADTFHALTSDRPYRDGMPYEKAFEIISGARETQLCPESVDLFFEWVKSKGDYKRLY